MRRWKGATARKSSGENEVKIRFGRAGSTTRSETKNEADMAAAGYLIVIVWQKLFLTWH
jgi:hypothetical protein